MDCMLISHVDSAVSSANVNWRIVIRGKLFRVALVLQWTSVRSPLAISLLNQVGGSVQKRMSVQQGTCVTCPAIVHWAIGILWPL